MSLKDKFDSLKKKASSIKNEIFKWLKRLFLYSVLGIVVIAISHYIFSYFGFLHTDIDSARYMLSALVQGEAAVVALVVTLSLVAVQLAAQSYSARVIEVFRKAPDLWILMFIYGVAIFYGLFVLKLIGERSISDLEIYISGAYYFGVFAFVALVPYMLKMFEMLKPSTVIDMLAEKITKENILSVRFEESGEKDPIQPIVDIVHGSMMKYDYETRRSGLRAIRSRTNLLIKNENIDNDEKYYILVKVSKHLNGIAKLAISRKDEQSVLDTITNLTMIGNKVAEQKLGSVNGIFSLLASYISHIGIAVSEQNLKYASKGAIFGLVKLGQTTAKYKLEETKDIILYLNNIFTEAIKQRNEYVLGWRKGAYNSLIDVARENNLEDIALVAEESFKEVNDACRKLIK